MRPSKQPKIQTETLPADAGLRSEAVFEQLKGSPSELIVALGREGKRALEIDGGQYPLHCGHAGQVQDTNAK